MNWLQTTDGGIWASVPTVMFTCPMNWRSRDRAWPGSCRDGAVFPAHLAAGAAPNLAARDAGAYLSPRTTPAANIGREVGRCERN